VGGGGLDWRDVEMVMRRRLHVRRQEKVETFYLYQLKIREKIRNETQSRSSSVLDGLYIYVE
jgi:hypothetical protein